MKVEMKMIFDISDDCANVELTPDFVKKFTRYITPILESLILEERMK